MRVVTFYSFKGGVGRSMALTNVGLELANRGRSVLLVDFDLEAPGLSTFGLQRQRGNLQGMLEFVEKYLGSGESPDVRSYCERCPGVGREGGELWLMPAGDQTDSYGKRLNAIDWQAFYRERDGYLFFEDMRAQWDELIDPDYVLIDSRTGHTDVGGICTRQLPDAVVVLFFPNDQNLLGLRKVVADIRGEKEGERAREIELHFVTSNVPDLDDEDQILEERMASFRKTLGYKELTATIHHYNSLALLNQVIFTRDRPRSRLAREYVGIADAISRSNPEDRDGAMATLIDLHRNVRRRGKPLPFDPKLEDRLIAISEQHKQDGEILYHLSLVWERRGETENAAILLDQAIEAGYKSPESYLRRARQGEGPSVAADAMAALAAADANAIDVGAAIRLLAMREPSRLATPEAQEAIARLPRRVRIHAADLAMNSQTGLRAAISILQPIVADVDSTVSEQAAARSAMALAMIGSGQFDEAVLVLGNPSVDRFSLPTVFNRAMAGWGSQGSPDREEFGNLLKQFENASEDHTNTVNFQQCLSLTYAVMGQIEQAQECLRLARERLLTPRPGEFSAWRYLNVTMSEHLEDLDEMAMQYEIGELVPRFVSRVGQDN